MGRQFMNIDFYTYRQLEELLHVDVTWFKEHVDEISELTYSEAYHRYPMDTLKLSVRHKIGIPQPGCEDYLMKSYQK